MPHQCEPHWTSLVKYHLLTSVETGSYFTSKWLHDNRSSSVGIICSERMSTASESSCVPLNQSWLKLCCSTKKGTLETTGTMHRSPSTCLQNQRSVKSDNNLLILQVHNSAQWSCDLFRWCLRLRRRVAIKTTLPLMTSLWDLRAVAPPHRNQQMYLYQQPLPPYHVRMNLPLHTWLETGQLRQWLHSSWDTYHVLQMVSFLYCVSMSSTALKDR